MVVRVPRKKAETLSIEASATRPLESSERSAHFEVAFLSRL
jgi:hypothetical protein